ncbi:pre-peptidase C-terminal domain-containing protein [Halobaculum limi]|uniref:pre-peptidase C-terminal domain-containing protein n=1 Tax=Halobaculum limi TaxID=3031916 RepID=UPI002407595F|nr:pre-peptidase C-terminal domain-containing protein [Halobaculum sp. YSMS11]
MADGEVHVYQIDLDAGDTLNVTLLFENAAGNLDLVVGRNTDSDAYLEQQREYSRSDTDNESVALTARANDTFTIRVSGRTETTNNSYTLDVNRVTPDETDRKEPNWNPASASTVTEGRYNLNITTGDTDWHKIDLDAGDTLTVITRFSNAAGNLDLSIHRDTDGDGYYERLEDSHSNTDNEQVAFTARANASYYINIKGRDQYSTRAAYTLVLDRVTPNETAATEPNWNPESAAHITEGTYADREITRGDTDWYAINLSAGDTVNISAIFSDEIGNLDLEVRRDRDSDTYYEYIEGTSSNSDNEQVAFTARANDTYYIHIEGRNQYTTAATYDLIVNRTTPDETDSDEPNWNAQSAAPITEGQYEREFLTGDTDWYALSLNAGDTVNISALFNNSQGNLDLTVRANTDDDQYLEYVEGASTNSDNEQVAFTARQNTTYYIHIDGREQYSTSADYTLAIDRVTPNETDATEPNWNTKSATPLSEGRYNLEFTQGDDDWYAVDLNAGDTLNLSVLFEQSDGNLDLSVRSDTDGDGYLEYVEDSSTNSDNEQVAFTALHSGTYYVHIDGRDQYTTAAPYTLVVDRVTPDENDPAEPTFSRASAAPLPASGTTFNLTRGDVDWYVIGVRAGEELTISAGFDHSVGDLEMDVYSNTDQDGDLDYVDSAQTNTDDESLSLGVSETGFYYVRVYGDDDDTTATPYTLTTSSTGSEPPVNLSVTREELPNGRLNISVVVTNTRASSADQVTVDLAQIGGDWTIESRSSEGGQWSSDFSWQWASLAGGESKRASIIIDKRTDQRPSPRVATVTVSNSSANTDAEVVSLWRENTTTTGDELTVEFDWEPTSPTTADSITFTGNASTTANASDISYAWDLDSDGLAEATGTSATRSFPLAGEFPVTLMVRDGNGNTNRTTKFVSVSPAGNLDEEPNDLQEDSTNVIEGRYNREITSGDVDWYAINLSAGTTVNISTLFDTDTGDLSLVVGRNTDNDEYLEERYRSYTDTDNEQLAFTATANATYYIRVEGERDTSTAPYTLSIDRVTPAETDASEPNWDPESATKLTEGRYDRELTVGDTDWYAINLSAGDTLTAIARFSNSAGNLDLTVRRDTDGDQYYEYIEGASSNSDNERVAFTATQNGTYYVHIDGRNRDTTSALYTLVLNRVTPDENDASEPTWDSDSAAEVTEGRYNRTITAGDVDWYAVDLNAGDTVNISVLFDNNVGNLDFVVRSNHDNDDYLEYIEGASSNSDNEQVAFTARHNGTYYINIEGRHQYTTQAPYTLAIDRVTPNETDATEPQWDLDSATTVTEGRYDLEFTQGDTDWYAIRLDAGDTVDIRALFEDSEGNLDLTVRHNRDDDDYVEYLEDSTTNTDNEQLAFTAKQSGVYYIHVDGRNQYTTETPYTLDIDRVTPSENDASEPTYNRDSAAVITDGTISRNLTRGDVDYYVVGLAANEQLSLDVLFDNSRGNLNVELRGNTDDDEYVEYIDRASSNSDNESLSYRAERAGVYYIKVTGRDDDTTAAPYRLRLNTSDETPPVDVEATTKQLDSGNLNLTITVTNTQSSATSDVTVDGSQIGGNWQIESHSSEGGQWSSDISWQWDSLAAGETRQATVILSPRSQALSTPRFAVISAQNSSATTDVEAASLWVGNRSDLTSLEATFDWQPQPPAPGESLTLNATVTSSSASVTAYRWDVDSDGYIEATGKTASTSFPMQGMFPVELAVENADNQTARVTKFVTVGDANRDAVASNEQQSDATPLLEGRYRGSITADDTDWYAVNLAAGQTVNISTRFSNQEGNLDLVVGRSTDDDAYLEERYSSSSSTDDEQLAFTAQANATYYIKVVGRDASTNASYTLSIDRVTAAETDASEPNWDPASAAQITEGRYDRELTTGDTDWYAIDLNAGDTLAVITRFSNDAGNLDLTVRTNRDDDDYLEYVEGASSNSDNEQVAFTARHNGTYYIHIDGRDRDTTNAPYTLIADRVTPDETDAGEPTWNAGSAAPITEGSGTYEITRGDTDWYEISLNAGDTVNITAFFDNSAGNLDMEVRANTDDDDYLEYIRGSNSNSDNEQLAFTARHNTSYYIHIDGRNQYTTAARYTLDVDRVEPDETDGSEPQWDRESAATITEGRYDFEFPAGDTDWYAISLNAGDSVNITALFNNSQGNLDIEVRHDDDDDRYLEYVESSSTESDNEQLAFTARQDGVYYIHVDGRDQDRTATNYTLDVDRLTPSENDPSEPTYGTSSADPVEPGAYNRTLVHGDVDWYVIGLSEGEQLNTSILFDDSVGNLDLEVRADDDDDGYIEYIDASDSYTDDEQLTITADTTGVYYIKVDGRDDDTTAAPYQLRVDRSGGPAPLDLDIESRKLPNGSVDISVVVTNTKSTTATDVIVDGAQIGGNWRVVNNSSEGGVWGADITWQWESIASGESKRATLVLAPRDSARRTPRFATFEARNSTARLDTAVTSLWLINRSQRAFNADAEFTITPDTPVAGEQVQFDASPSTGNSTIVAYRWDLDNDGAVDATGPTAARTFTSGGDYLVTVSIETERGATDQITKRLTVAANESDSDNGTSAPPALPGFAAPTDPDGDGYYEDVNGDGRFTIADIQTLFTNLNSSAVAETPSGYDFNDDGTIDIVDVQRLYVELVPPEDSK